MPNIAFFQRMGVFAIKDFLDAESCHAIQAEMLLPQSVSPAEVTTADGIDRVDEAIRKTKLVKVTNQTKSLIKEHLSAIKSDLEAHFATKLDACENPQFLAYKEGDFFKPHTDSSTSYQAHDFVQQRRVSVVLFLNGESSIFVPDSYLGGNLILYGLIQQPRWENYGFKIQGEPGLPIAFASDVYHEVTTVTQGMRFTMVTWFPASVTLPLPPLND